ncbi:MAG: acyl-CoA dehydrogenase family protein [Pseudomonadales bacterium]|tara:strand:+ start:991 stop:2208 length:1218 start_codon:yes stop_codon:yes gene_type:complete
MTDSKPKIDDFRLEVSTWLEENFPKSLNGKASELSLGKNVSGKLVADSDTWRKNLAAQGWGTPTWPLEYGGAGLSQKHAQIINEEMDKRGAFNPIPMLAGMGVTMVGPTILEYGTEAQKRRHLPRMASGEIFWCLGYSEPGAGSDLASLATKAEDKGDHWLINGQKVWTSGADIAQWCGALVRTDPKAKKRSGISFVMFPMDQPGVRTRPVKLISGDSPFCEMFFDDAKAEKDELLGDLNDGWSLGKRLLQHERQSQTGEGGPATGGEFLGDIAKRYVGTNENGTLEDTDLRLRLANHLMDEKAHKLTIRRIMAEAKGNVEVTAVASILKNSATDVAQSRTELLMELMGSQGLGWEGNEYNQDELASVRMWLGVKAMSIYGGSYEVQKNIISKNILGLPETTQKG